MQITVHLTGMHPNSAAEEYAREKAEGLSTYFDGILAVDIDMGMKSHHHQKGEHEFYAEFKVQIPGKPSIYMVKEADDLYKAIDKVKEHLKVELDKVKGKMHRIDRDELRESKAYNGEE